jgi:DNA polymerase-3 subunit delta'
MGLQSIHYGNQAVKGVLVNFLQKKRIPAVSLFYGPSGSGKSFFAFHFIQDILCTETDGVNCCNICASCKTVKALTSPDLLKISSTDGSSIKIEDIKKAQEFSALKPCYSDRKIIWIEDAHLLTIEAFNSILKILEEPNLTTNFLLTTSKLDSILPTVRSRATAIPFSLYSETEILQILPLYNCPENHIVNLSKLGNGNIKKAISYLDPALLENRKIQIDYFLKLMQQPSFLIPYQSKEDIIGFITTSQTILQDLSQMKLFPGITSIINMDFIDLFDPLVKKLDIQEITRVWELFINAEMDLSHINVNLKAFFELLCVSIKNTVLFC